MRERERRSSKGEAQDENGNRADFAQDMASKGIGIVYGLADATLRKGERGSDRLTWDCFTVKTWDDTHTVSFVITCA